VRNAVLGDDKSLTKDNAAITSVLGQ
jgi:hypothetical protein